MVPMSRTGIRNLVIMLALAGLVFISHTKVNGRITLRVAISNLRTEDEDLQLVWDVIRREAAELGQAS